MLISPSNSNTSATSSAETRERFLERALSDHESPLVSYTEMLTREIDSARVIVCEAFLQLSRQNHLRIGEDVKSWLFAYCRKTALKTGPKEPATQPAEDLRWKRIAGPEQTAAEANRPIILRFLARFPTEQQEVILLKFQYRLTYPQIREVTDLPVPTISALIQKGLTRLRQLLEDDTTSV